MYNCPLPIEKQQYEKADKLIKDCADIHCGFLHRAELGGDIPPGCLLIIASLFAMNREKTPEKKCDACLHWDCCEGCL